MKTGITKLINKIPSKNFLEIVFLGLLSGLPFSILYTSLITWLIEEGLTLSVVTTLAISRIPYSLKFLWAPFIDKFKLPILHKSGRRKSWMILSCLINSIILVILSLSNAKDNFSLIYLLSIYLGFSSATFDIAFDAFRIDTLSSKEQGYGVACAVLGYRIGILVASAGTLYFSAIWGWKISFLILATIFGLGILYIPLINEQEYKEKENVSFIAKIKTSVISPFIEFFNRTHAIYVLFAIILYKVGGVLLGFVSTPFYLEIGYKKEQIASIVKTFGLGATIAGTFIGGQIISKVGNLKGLIICGVIQAFVHLIFVWLHHAEVAWHSLLIAICFENIGGGAGTVAEIAYLSALCNKAYSATQYALLSSFAVLLNSTISIKAGKMVEYFGWDYFFLSTVVLSFPALLIFIFLSKQHNDDFAYKK